jgi:hypothetical protein
MFNYKLELLFQLGNVEKYEKEHEINTLESTIDAIVNSVIKVKEKDSYEDLIDYGYDEYGEIDKCYGLSIEYISTEITKEQLKSITDKVQEIIEFKHNLWKSLI